MSADAPGDKQAPTRSLASAPASAGDVARREDVVWPDFFIAGAPRCGTTSLAFYLRAHPQICFSSPKETHYFLARALEPKFEQDPQRYYIDRFFSHFDASRHRAMGEGSVSYLYFPEVIEQILELNPEARFIVMLRNPMAMLPSFHARMLFVLEEDCPDFAEAWDLQELRARGERIPPRCLMPTLLQYAEIGKLGKYLAALLERVPQSQCLPILHDDLVASPAAVYREVLDFLGVEFDGRREFDVKLPSGAYRSRWLQQLLFKPPGGVLSFVGDNDVQRYTLFRAVRRLRQWIIRLNSFDARVVLPPGSPMHARMRDAFQPDSELLGEILGRDLRHWYA